jgi:CBS domain-containing protein
MWWPALGGVIIGLGGWIEPRVLGVGYETIHHLMRGEVAGATLIGLLLAKGIVWSVALGSGTSGGVLAPLLMMGGALGALLGSVFVPGDAGLWAMVGMGAMMGGTMRAPFTGMVFLLELSHDLNALPALLVGSVAAFCVTVLLLRRSILTEKLARRGQHIACEYSVDLFALKRVADVMDRAAPLMPANATVAELVRCIDLGGTAVAKRHATLLADATGRLTGIVTRGDLMRALQRDPAGTARLGEIASGPPVVVHSDDTLAAALEKMLARNIGRLPVVDRTDPAQVVGHLGRAEILAARLHLHHEENHRERGPLLSAHGHG